MQDLFTFPSIDEAEVVEPIEVALESENQELDLTDLQVYLNGREIKTLESKKEVYSYVDKVCSYYGYPLPKSSIKLEMHPCWNLTLVESDKKISSRYSELKTESKQANFVNRKKTNLAKLPYNSKYENSIQASSNRVFSRVIYQSLQNYKFSYFDGNGISYLIANWNFRDNYKIPVDLIPVLEKYPLGFKSLFLDGTAYPKVKQIDNKKLADRSAKVRRVNKPTVVTLNCGSTTFEYKSNLGRFKINGSSVLWESLESIYLGSIISRQVDKVVWKSEFNRDIPNKPSCQQIKDYLNSQKLGISKASLEGFSKMEVLALKQDLITFKSEDRLLRFKKEVIKEDRLLFCDSKTCKDLELIFLAREWIKKLTQKQIRVTYSMGSEVNGKTRSLKRETREVAHRLKQFSLGIIPNMRLVKLDGSDLEGSEIQSLSEAITLNGNRNDKGYLVATYYNPNESINLGIYRILRELWQVHQVELLFLDKSGKFHRWDDKHKQVTYWLQRVRSTYPSNMKFTKLTVAQLLNELQEIVDEVSVFSFDLKPKVEKLLKVKPKEVELHLDEIVANLI